MAHSIDAARPQPPIVGQPPTWTFRYSNGPVSWDWSHGHPHSTELRSIRTPRSSEKSRHIPVHAFCMTTGGVVHVESGLEHDLLMTVDRRPDVTWVVSQPARLRFRSVLTNRPRTHTPDLLTLATDGTVTVWDVRPEAKQDDSFREAVQVTSAACSEVGWRYEVFAGLPQVHTYNLRWLTAYRAKLPWYQSARPILAETLTGPGHTIGDVLTADSGAGHLVSALWHFAWSGSVVLDLERPLTRATPIEWLASELPDG